MRAAISVAIAAAFACPAAVADQTPWVDDTTTTILTTEQRDAAITVRRRAMVYQSGYLWLELDAIVTRAGRRTTTRLFGPGPTMCAAARAIAGGVEVAVCTERFGDTRAVVRWQLADDDHLIAGARARVSPYARTAVELVARLQADARADAALARQRDRLGDTPDGQGTITWWWDAHDLLARWPYLAELARDDPDRARDELAPLVHRLLAPDDDGAPGARAAVAHDLRFVPRTLQPPSPPIAGPRPDVTGALVAAHALLRGGAADDVALADRLCPAIVAGAIDAIVAALPSPP